VQKNDFMPGFGTSLLFDPDSRPVPIAQRRFLDPAPQGYSVLMVDQGNYSAEAHIYIY
jgi:hypothetical protein